MPHLPWRFGGYRLEEMLGTGGVWSVFVARQDFPNRIVALKVATSATFASRDSFDRFRTEIGPVARLAHPNIVSVFEFGECEGYPYFSMEFMTGGTLAAKLGDGPLSERESAELVRTLALAVQYAHESRITHQDLQPAKVLLGLGGEVKLTGFKEARLLDGDGRWTLTEAARGTGLYMAPEQTRADYRKDGIAADVWALGAILYECLTSRPPFPVSDLLNTLERLRTGEAKPLSQQGLDLELEAIYKRCLEKDPRRRYRSARALADDLGRWLRGEPTKFHTVGFANRVLRAVRRLWVWRR